MSDLPEYFTVSGLIKRARISRSTFERHRRNNVAGIEKARMDISGLGIVYKGRGCRDYIEMHDAKAAGKTKSAV